jgi:hypothetical protein
MFASSAGLCERQTAGIVQLPENLSHLQKGSSQFYFALGSTFEQVMEKAFLNAGVYVDSEPRIESYHPELNVSGRIDFVLRDPDDGELVLAELKSCGGKLPDRPRPYQLAQIKVYMALTGMPRGLLWYVSRSIAGWDGKILQRAFDVQMTRPELFKVINTMVKGQLHLNANTLPDKPFDMKKSHCGFCPLYPHCWNDDEIKFTSNPPKKSDLADLLRDAQRITEEIIDHQPILRDEFVNQYPPPPTTLF